MVGSDAVLVMVGANCAPAPLGVHVPAHFWGSGGAQGPEIVDFSTRAIHRQEGPQTLRSALRGHPKTEASEDFCTPPIWVDFRHFAAFGPARAQERVGLTFACEVQHFQDFP